MRIRAASPDDALQVAGVHVRSWQVAYRGLLPDEYLDGLRPEDRAHHYTFGDQNPESPLTFVALDDVIRGFVTVGRAADPDGLTGEISALYVDPPFWGLGIGGLLLAHAHTRLRSQGFT